MKRLDKKLLLIVAGSGGIGKVTAQKALDECTNVILVYIDTYALEKRKTT